MSDSLRRHRRYTVQGMRPGQNTGWVIAFPSPGIFPAGSDPGLPALQMDSLPADHQGSPKNTGSVALSLLQRDLPDQEWNPGLPLGFAW